jgi:hypothetical protein
VTGSIPPRTAGGVAVECPPPGSSARVVRQVTAAGICP